MRVAAVLALGLFASPPDASAEGLRFFQTYYDEQSVETRTLSIRLNPVDEDVRFAVTLTKKETGLKKRHEFDAPVPEIPEPFQMEVGYYCDASIILLTVKYPWHHDWPQVVRALETYAFRESDFEFIDVAFGPLTDIALQDSTYPEDLPADMLPPVGVRCLSGSDGKPFEFFEQETK